MGLWDYSVRHLFVCCDTLLIGSSLLPSLYFSFLYFFNHVTFSWSVSSLSVPVMIFFLQCTGIIKERKKERRSGMRRLFSARRFIQGRVRLWDTGCDRAVIRQGQTKHHVSSAIHPHHPPPPQTRPRSVSAHVRLRLQTPALLEATKYLTHWRIGNPLRVCSLFNLSLLFIEYIYGDVRSALRVGWFDSASLRALRGRGVQIQLSRFSKRLMWHCGVRLYS